MKETILVIEDNEQNLYLMRFLLEQHGYQVMAAPDGKTGVELAGRCAPHLILLDIQLPEMDGYAVAKALRAQPSLSETPIIAVTSYAMPGDREKTLAAGATDYVEKPIDPETFVSRIQKHLPVSAAREEAEKGRPS